MSKLSDISADTVLKSMLQGKVYANKDEVKVFGHQELPNTETDTDFITIEYNGNIQSLTNPLGIFVGNIALSLYNEVNTDGTAKRNRIKLILAQIEDKVNNVSAEGYVFKISSTPITPVTVNATTGYSVTTLNIEWWCN
jgi:hypothetical protein